MGLKGPKWSKNTWVDHFGYFWTPLGHFGMLTSLTCLAIFICFIVDFFWETLYLWLTRKKNHKKNLDHLYTGKYALWIIRRLIKPTGWPHGIPQTSLLTIRVPVQPLWTPFGPLNAPLDHIGPFRSTVLPYKWSEDPSIVAVDPMEHFRLPP